MKRWLGLSIAVLAGMVFYYLSRFWGLSLWSRDGLFGLKQLSPNGGLLGRWLQGTPLAPFELLIWIAGVFLILTYLQKGFDKAFKS